MQRFLWTGALALTMTVSAAAVGADAPSKPLPFTAAQAKHGQDVFAVQCSSCHGANADGGPGGPPLKGGAFRMRFQPQAGDGLFTFIHEKMPPGAGGTLSPSDTADLVAHVLTLNGGKPGKTALPSDAKALAPLSLEASLPEFKMTGLPIPQAPQGVPPDHFTTEVEKQRAELLAKARPVTDEMLRNPADGDWINARRTYDAHGFSPLTQINRENVAKLEMGWVWELPASKNQITPLVHDGLMFVASNGHLQALNAATGDLLWEYTRPGSYLMLRNLAIYGENIYFAADTHMVAVNMRTGKAVWEKQVVPDGQGLRLTAGPLIVKGVVTQGAAYCTGPFPGGCYIVGLDAATGKELWRFNTLARPGQPGGDSWNKAPVDERFGGGVWVAGSYDPELNLVYYGTGQTYKTATLLENYDGTPGGNDALYTNTTVALRPETGELVWYYQHHNRDVWDLDWAFERTIATLTIDGKPRKTVTTGGKLAIFDTLDAATGEYLFSYDIGLQNLIKSIDPKTGKKIVDPKYDPPKPGVMQTYCTSTLGGRDWPATSFNAKTGVMFVPENELCTDHTYTPGGHFDLVERVLRRVDGDGMIGRLEAIDLTTRKSLWVQRRRAPHSSAILGTAGGLLFEGWRDRLFRASDQRTGKVLWETQLNLSPNATPITYSVDGVQYVAITTGGGGSLDGLVGSVMAPEIAVPPSGTTLWVFRLPHKK
jgi:alcohol dehydrogenase (cytochrome c)